MFDSAVLDVAFGLVFVFVILSFACSALNETISSIFNWRAAFLRRGIANLLEPANLERGLEQTGKLLEHPLLNALVRPVTPRSKRRHYPSYVPSRTFVAALLDFDQAGARRGVEEAIAAVPSDDARRALTTLWERAGRNQAQFTRDAERWFDDSMERVSGWYRRRVQKVLWALALTLVVALNIDTFRIADQLWTQKAVRAAVVARAEAAQPRAGATGLKQVASDVTDLQQLSIPIGWSAESRPEGGDEWLLRGRAQGARARGHGGGADARRSVLVRRPQQGRAASIRRRASARERRGSSRRGRGDASRARCNGNGRDAQETCGRPT